MRDGRSGGGVGGGVTGRASERRWWWGKRSDWEWQRRRTKREGRNAMNAGGRDGQRWAATGTCDDEEREGRKGALRVWVKRWREKERGQTKNRGAQPCSNAQAPLCPLFFKVASTVWTHDRLFEHACLLTLQHCATIEHSCVPNKFWQTSQKHQKSV